MSTITVSPTRKRVRVASTSTSVAKRANNNTNRVKSIVNIGRGFPTKSRAVLRYMEDLQGALNPGSASYTNYLFKANSIYDPNSSGTGHQPYGHDTYQTMYNHYTVYKSRITVHWMTSPDYPQGFIVGTNIVPGSSDADIPQTKIEKQEGKPNYKFINHATARGEKSTITWTKGKYFDKTKADGLTAAFGADPTELSYFDVWCQNKAAATTYCGAFVVIEYWVEFTEPKSLGGS